MTATCAIRAARSSARPGAWATRSPSGRWPAAPTQRDYAQLAEAGSTAAPSPRLASSTPGVRHSSCSRSTQGRPSSSSATVASWLELETRRVALAPASYNKGSLSAGPPSAGSFSCPSGQKLVLADVAYTGITLTDTTNNVTASLADITRVFFTF